MKYLLGIFIILIYGLLAFYIGYNFLALLHSYNFAPWPVLYWFIVFLISFAFIIARLHPSLSLLSIIGNYWMFILEYGVILCVLANIALWLSPLSTKFVGTTTLALFVVLFAIGTYFAYTPVVRHSTVTLAKEGQPMRIVLASDFHLGYLSNKRHLQKFVKLSNAQNPDIVLLAGDIVDDIPDRYIAVNMQEEMVKLKASYGVYGILGNHEYYGNAIERFLKVMEASNVNMLLDETIELPNGMYLTGREDRTNKMRKLYEKLTPENTDAPWIVMNHTPDDLTIASIAGVDIHVSGHTHKGQLWPNQLLTRRIFELDYGYKLINTMHTFVSSGYGFWGPPMRIGSQAEIWVIDVEFSPK